MIDREEFWSDGSLRRVEVWDRDNYQFWVEVDQTEVPGSRRSFTPSEEAQSTSLVADRRRDTNTDQILSRLDAALNTNNQYLALPAPTATQTRQQVDRLTREVNALMRLQRRELLDDVSDTE